MCSPLNGANSLASQLEGITIGGRGKERPPLMRNEKVGARSLIERIALGQPMTCADLEFYLREGCLTDTTLYLNIHLFSPFQDDALRLLIDHKVPFPEADTIKILFQGGCTQQTLVTLVQQGALVLSSQDYDATPVASDPMGWLDCLVRHEIPPLPRTLHLLLMNLSPKSVGSDFFRRVYTTFLPQTELDADLFNLVLWHYGNGDLLRDLVGRGVPINLTTFLLIQGFNLEPLLTDLTQQITTILEHLSPAMLFIFGHEPARGIVFDEVAFNEVWSQKQELSADLLNLALVRWLENGFILTLIERGVQLDSVSDLIMKSQSRN